MTPQELGALLGTIAGILLSLAASFLPGFSDWYYGLPVEKRGLVMVGFGLLGAGGLYLTTCVLALFPLLFVCGWEGVKVCLIAFVLFVLSNQATYLVSPESPTKRDKRLREYALVAEVLHKDC